MFKISEKLQKAVPGIIKLEMGLIKAILREIHSLCVLKTIYLSKLKIKTMGIVLRVKVYVVL